MEGSILARWEENQGARNGKRSGVGFSAQQPVYGDSSLYKGFWCLLTQDGEHRYVRADPTMAFVWLVGFFGFWMPSLDDFYFFSLHLKAATYHFRRGSPSSVVESARARQP